MEVIKNNGENNADVATPKVVLWRGGNSNTKMLKFMKSVNDKFELELGEFSLYFYFPV